jgi:RNA polymerase sigma-70 factor (ECF subfamily)
MILVERRELLDGFRRGDRAALAEVYRHYVKDVARFLRRGFSFSSEGRPFSFRGFGGGYEVEAAVQEVFRRAFEERARQSYNGIDPYRPYLLRIARNTVINDLKSKQPILFRFRAGRPVILESAPDEPEPGQDPFAPLELSPEELAEAQEVAEIVRRFKSSLDARASGVFLQRFEEGLSAEDTASKLGLTRSQVRTTEAKLREAFLRHLEGSGYLEAYRSTTAAGASSRPEQVGALIAFVLMIAAGGGR